MIKIAIPLANGFEEIEAIVPVDIWRRAGFEVVMLSISNELIVTGAHQISVLADGLLDETQIDDAAMLFLPGGMPGAQNLDNHQPLNKMVNEFATKGKVLGAICAAPLILGHNNLLNGKRATCFPGFENELYGAAITGQQVETDGNIVTAIGAGSAVEFAFSIVARFKGEEFAKELSLKMKVKQY
jgi:protein deglycase